MATFEFAGGDTDMIHSEAHTTVVSLSEFHAMHTIYNVNNNSNKLEICNQMQDFSGKLFNDPSVILQIPNGSYNITSLVQILNEQMFAKMTNGLDQNGNSYNRGFGDKSTYNLNATIGEIPAFYVDYVETSDYTPRSGFTSTAQNKVSGKIKFTTPSTYRLSGVGLNVNNDVTLKANSIAVSKIPVFPSIIMTSTIKTVASDASIFAPFTIKCTLGVGSLVTRFSLNDPTNDFQKICVGMSISTTAFTLTPSPVVITRIYKDGNDSYFDCSMNPYSNFTYYGKNTYDNVSISCNRILKNSSFTAVTDVSKLAVGMSITGDTLTSGTTIVSINDKIIGLSSPTTADSGDTTQYSSAQQDVITNVVKFASITAGIVAGMNVTATINSKTYIGSVLGINGTQVIISPTPEISIATTATAFTFSGYSAGSTVFGIVAHGCKVGEVVDSRTSSTNQGCFPINTTIVSITTNSFTTSNANTDTITSSTLINVGNHIVQGSNILKVTSLDKIVVGSLINKTLKSSGTDVIINDCYVTAITLSGILSNDTIPLPIYFLSLSANFGYQITTSQVFQYTNYGMKVIGNGKTRLHRGFYILTDNYKGLPEIMGYTDTASIILPTYSSAVLNIPQRGHGITLLCSVAPSPTTFVTPVYTLDPSYCNVRQVVFDCNDSTATPAKTASFVTPYPYGVFTCQASDYPALDYPRNIYICVDQMTTKNRCSNQKFSYGSVLAKIPTNQNFGNTILYEPYNVKELYLPGLSMDTFTVRLYDDNANPIQWNGGHWTLILNVTFNIDVGSAGLEDASMGRTYRPYLKRTLHDPLTTSREFSQKRIHY